MKNYLNNLIKQYQKATGIKHIDIHSKEFMIEFNLWLKNRKEMAKKYGALVAEMDLYPYLEDGSIEIGKGAFDSIALDKRILMITPYSESVKRATGGIITADFMVEDCIPSIIRPCATQKEKIDTRNIGRFITQNPYNEGCIRNWDQLHNSGKNITVGVFGSVYDKDKEKKLNQLIALRSKLAGYYIDEYETQDDMYFYAISSHTGIKELGPRVRTR